MARVRSFRAFRYASPSVDITPLTAPPYDVVSEAKRAELLERSAHNVVALELPEGPLDSTLPNNRYATGATRWEKWRREGVVVQDADAAIYVLEQRWRRGDAEARRVAFIAAVGLERFDDAVVLPHERTLPKALDDRLSLTRACAANFSPVFGLFSDPTPETSEILEQTMSGRPLEYARGDDGVENRLWTLTDENAIRRLEGFFSGAQIFIADGHHRYLTALTYRDERRAAAVDRRGAVVDATDDSGVIRSMRTLADEPPYDFVMMALANMDDPELVVLPTHRVADAAADFDSDQFWQGLTEHFEVGELPPGHPADALRPAEPISFIVQTRDGKRRLVRLRDDVDLDRAIPLAMSSAWKHLDVAVLQELVLSPLLDIHPDRPETLDRLTFVKDAHEALRMESAHDVVFVLRPTRMQQLRDVALAGETMPQKSTYFYPKLLSGLVMRSLA